MFSGSFFKLVSSTPNDFSLDNCNIFCVTSSILEPLIQRLIKFFGSLFELIELHDKFSKLSNSLILSGIVLILV